MEKRLIPVAAFFMVAFLFFAFVGFDTSMTGFAVFNQGDQVEFDLGSYNNTEYNAGGVILTSGQVSGEYVSEVFDAGNKASWNNLTWVAVNYEAREVLVTSALHGGSNQTAVFLNDDNYYLADMKDASKGFYLNFSENLINGTVLKIYAKKNNGASVGIYDQSDSVGSVPLGVFTVDSDTGGWYNITLNINTPTDAIWLGEGVGSGVDPREEFDYIYAEISGTDLAVEVRSCDDSLCSGETWVGVSGVAPQDLDLDSNEYFQYKFNFMSPDSSITPFVESVSVDYDLINSAPSILIVSPQDILYLDNESLDLSFIAEDDDFNLDSCWYNLGGSNISIVDCVNISFSVSGSGDYVLEVFVNDSLGLISSDLVEFSVDLNGVSVNIVEPVGVKNSRSSISLEYDSLGKDIFCWYNVKTSIGGEVISNTTLVNCSNSVFDVSSDGDYIINIYLNNSFGSSEYDSSSFSVDTSEPPAANPPSSGGGGGGGGGGSFVPVSSVGSIVLSSLSDVVFDSGETRGLALNVENGKLTFLDGCRLTSYGEYSDWFSSDEIMGLAGGQANDFDFELSVPSSVDAGTYEINIRASCEDLNSSVSFNVDILPKKIGFELISVDRISDEEVKIVYFLEEFSGVEQNVELQFLLLDSSGEKVSEKKESRVIGPDYAGEFEVIVMIDESFGGDMSLLANLNSETYSTFVQENIIVGAPMSGFSIVGGEGNIDRISSIILAIVFLIFGIFIIRRTAKSKKNSGKAIKKKA